VGRRLTTADHRARMEEKLWAGKRDQALRMLSRVDTPTRRLAEARLKLQRRARGVDAAVAAVPAQLQSDPGLLFDRARFRRRAGDLLGAYDLLKDVAPATERRETVWRERHILARRLLRDGRYREATIIASGHGLEAGVGFAEAEFLSGWLRTRFLDEPLDGYRNFSRLFHGVGSPISQSRGAYWSGRASEAVGDMALAERWYAVAAQHGATYYGQLAAARSGVGLATLFPEAPASTAADRAALAQHDLADAIAVLIQIGATEHVRSFFYALRGRLGGPGEGIALTEMLERAGLTRLALAMAKTLARDGVYVKRALYPRPTYVANARAGGPELPLVLALIRQESAFDDRAISRAGARGLMQLMPQTARTVARGLGLPYSRSRLITDPAYNMTLGRTYLGQRLDRFEGSYPLSLAAYNAGSGRVDRWITEFGDPRSDGVDPVDWVERIPFSETRNYVQRILESLQVYRALLGRTQLARSLNEDLTQ
ncbi:MAG: lytic transglycosylase domain-containing protein, partial [Pseudomonadota bacterium]